jgi:hypothetical protein
VVSQNTWALPLSQVSDCDPGESIVSDCDPGECIADRAQLRPTLSAEHFLKLVTWYFFATCVGC